MVKYPAHRHSFDPVFLQNAKIETQLHEKPIEGTIIEILVGNKGGGVGKYSDRSTCYH